MSTSIGRRVLGPLVFLLALAACGNVLVFEDAGVDGGSDPPDAAVDAAVAGALVVSSDRLDVDEGATASFTVALAAPADTSVTVTVESSAPGGASATPNQVVFPPGEVAPRTVTVVGVTDVDVLDEAVTIVLRAPDRDQVSVAVAVSDPDTVALVATPGAMLEVSEGGTAPLLVRLSAQPSAPVTVTATSASAAVATVAPATLTFAPQTWDVDQTITVTAVHDVDTAPGAASLALRAAGLADLDVPLRVIDDDVLGIQPSTTNLGLLAEGGTRTFEVRLSQQPAAAVTVALASDDPAAVAVAPPTLTFTPSTWNQAQLVTASAPADVDLADESVTITLSATGLAARTVSAAVDDDDVQSITVAPATLAVAEGGSATFQVRLAYQPASAVTVTVASANPFLAAASPSSLVFSPAAYATSQTVTVTGVSDADAASASAAIDLVAAAAGVSARVTANVTDDDVLAIETTDTAVTLVEGGTATFGVRLTAQPLATTTVTVTSSDPAAASVSAPLTFTTGTWNQLQNVTITGVGDLDLADESATLTATATGLGPRTIQASVDDDDVQRVLVDPPVLTLTEGANEALWVKLAFIPAGPVTVTLVVDEPTVAKLSLFSLTFTPANHAIAQEVGVNAPHDPDATDNTTVCKLTTPGAIETVVEIDVTDDDQ